MSALTKLLQPGLRQRALELRQLHASPNQIGVTLSMFGFGMLTSNGSGASSPTASATACLLPLLVTTHLGLSAASAGTAMLAVGLLGGVLLVPGGSASTAGDAVSP
jgi:hypothetical protein